MKKGAEERIYSMAARIASQISEAINDEECENYVDLEEEDATEFFHALFTVAPAAVYFGLTGEQKTVIEISHLANQLCFQFTERPKEQ